MHNLFVAILAVAVLVVGGAFMFSYLEGHSFFNSLYFVVLSITTVGASTIPATMNGKIFSMLVTVLGMGLVLYLVMLLARIVIEGQFSILLKSIRGGFTKMKNIKNHTIVCGHGKLGKYAVKTLIENKEKFVIIESDHAKVTELIGSKMPVVEGDALDLETLKKANISKAKALVAAMGNDADSIYLLMAAKELNDDILLASKATTEEAVDRLHQIGAQIVVLPEVVGGKQIVEAVLEVKKTRRLSTLIKKDKKKK